MDWQLTCRVCLESGDMVSLFDWDENNEQLADKYKYCCGIDVPRNDTLPTLICLNCVDRLTFAYQFKHQCLTSVETLKECLEEFEKSTAEVSEASTSKNGTETETITIKQENGVLLQYELPIEHEPTWSRMINKAQTQSVLAKAPGQRKRGRPRKYPNEDGQIELSPYQRKKPKPRTKEPPSLQSLLEENEGEKEMKKEPEGDDDNQEDGGGGDYSDPDFAPDVADEASDDHEAEIKQEVTTPRKRGRPRKKPIKEEKETMNEEDEDMLLKETILAISEPIPDHILNPKPKSGKAYNSKKKRYNYDKIHTCETCGASFASNASLQAHIRRHLGIKPFVCSICGYSCVLNMELRRHMLRHTGQKPYKCRICDRRFGDFGSRQKHERLHMGVRPYKCSVCGKAFTYSYVLSNHMLTHTGEKKFHCGICNKKFTKAHHLKYHNKVHHKEVFAQQQKELEEKRKRQKMQLAEFAGVLSGQIVDGNIQIITEGNEQDETENLMQVVEVGSEGYEEENATETDRAVAGMQVVLDSEFVINKI